MSAVLCIIEEKMSSTNQGQHRQCLISIDLFSDCDVLFCQILNSCIIYHQIPQIKAKLSFCKLHRGHKVWN